MNKYCFILLFLWLNNYSQINFPDPVFKAKLLEASEFNGIAYLCINNTYPVFNISAKIDTNNNNEIEFSEAQAVCVLFLPQANITDISGIENFTNLKILNVGLNSLISLNVSQLISLKNLFVRNNQLTSLNISNLIDLSYLSCENNQISSINFINNPQLIRAYCGNNLISSLDFSSNPLFYDLGCKNNPNLTTLKIKNGTTQFFGNQTIGNECWTGNPNLTNICADTNEISALQSYLTSCNINYSGININSNCVLGLEEFAISRVSVYPNPTSGIFTLNLTNEKEDYNKLTLYNILGEKVFTTLVNPKQTNTINLSTFSNGYYIARLESDTNSISLKILKN